MDKSLLEGCMLSDIGEQAHALLPLFERSELERGHVVFEEGQPQRHAVLIEHGSLVRRKHTGRTQDGKGVLMELNSFGRGGCCGFHHLLKEDPSFARVEVESEKAVVWRVSADAFRALCTENPAFLLAWCTMLNKMVRKQSKVVHALSAVAAQRSEESQSGRLSVAFFDATEWTVQAFDREDIRAHLNMTFYKDTLSMDTVPLAAGFAIVSCFVNCSLSQEILSAVSLLGVQMIAMRCAGFDRVHVDTARALGFTIARVPAYSPFAVAEHALALLMTVNRRIHKAYNRAREANFGLHGLVGFDVHGKTVGIIGTGKIGRCFADIMLGMGCKLLCNDLYPSKELAARDNVKYVELDELFANADIISLHAPLLESTHNLINSATLKKMKPNCVLINTSRGGLVDSAALLEALQRGGIAAAGLDVYDKEEGLFFRDHSHERVADPVLVQLLALPNVVMTGHQAFLTEDALYNIAHTTLDNILKWKDGKHHDEHPNSIY